MCAYDQAIKKAGDGTSLVVQQLRLCALNAGGQGSIPGRGTGSHMLQLKTPHATTKTRHSQINTNFKGSRLLILWAQADAAGDNG